MHWKEIALTDDLTGLWNYRAFHKLYTKEIARARRHKYPLTLVFIDLNKFKVYNDTLGHIKGDNLLKRVSKVIIKQLREYDNVFRLGGDEFILLLPHTNKSEAREIMERINQKLKNNPKISISYGIAIYPVDTKSKTKLIELADQKMYKDKKRKALK